MSCEDGMHGALAATNTFNQLCDGKTGQVVGYMLRLQIQCAHCGQAFAFRGVPPVKVLPDEKLVWSLPTCSPDGLEARMPLIPVDMASNPLHNMIKKAG